MYGQGSITFGDRAERSANFAYPETHTHDAGIGLTEKTIHYISDIKEDPDWVREFRLNAYKTFLSKPMPTHWASKDLEAIVFDNIRYYLSGGHAAEAQLGRCAGRCEADLRAARHSGAGTEVPRRRGSAVRQRGRLFQHQEGGRRAGRDLCRHRPKGLKNHPEIFRKWFGKVIPTGDNKFSALNSAVFSGGSFIYVPPGVKVKHPLQAYFRINAENFGQFERTLIICR